MTFSSNQTQAALLYKPRSPASSVTDKVWDVPAGTTSAPVLRIAFLSYRSDPKVGGQGIYLHQAAAALARRGHHVDILSGPPYPEVPAGVRLIRIPSLDLYAKRHNGKLALRPRHFLSWTDLKEYFSHISGKFMEPHTFGARAARYLRDHAAAYDVVLDNQTLAPEIGRLPLPTVAVIHHPVHRDRDLAVAAAPDKAKRWLIRRWYGFLPEQERAVRRLKRVIVVSEASRRDVAECFAIPPDRITAVPLGIDREVFHPRPDVPRRTDLLVSTASADVPLKGLRYLLEAYAALLKTRPSLELVLVGQLRDGPSRAFLTASGLTSRVRFVQNLSRDELATLFASATICVTPSLYEGFGLPAAEAMSCGTPVVVTDGGALPETVGSSGLVVRRGDAEALRAAIDGLLGDPRRRGEMSAAGLEHAAAKFCWSRFAAAYEQILLDAVAAC